MSKATEILDSLHTLMQKKEMIVEGYDSRIETLKLMLEKEMEAEHADSLEFNGAIAYYRGQTGVAVGDWNELMQYVKKNDAFDVLQRRVSPAQLEKRINAGAKIKGVTITHSQVLIVADKKGKKE